MLIRTPTDAAKAIKRPPPTFALSARTHAALAPQIVDAFHHRPDASDFRFAVDRLEIVWARTHRFPIDNVANRVDPARLFARVYASARLADAQQRTVDVPVRAQAFFPAPVRVRVADMARRAPAHVARRRARLAYGRGMARRLVARLRGFARYFGDGIGSVTGRTLAQQFVSVGQAHGVRSARAFVAQVRARMRLSVAHLRPRTIVVVHARHLSATVRVVRVARKRTGRTLALGHVIVRHANGVQTAHRVIANRPARFRSGLGIVQTGFGR